jgi:hypothetical protein
LSKLRNITIGRIWQISLMVNTSTYLRLKPTGSTWSEVQKSRSSPFFFFNQSRPAWGGFSIYERNPPMSINFSKVRSLTIVATDDGFVAQLTYKSGRRRGMTFERNEPVDQLIAQAQQAGVELIPLPNEPQLLEGAIWCEWCGERPTAPGVPCDACRKPGTTLDDLAEQLRESGIIPPHAFGECVEFMGEPCDRCLIETDKAVVVDAPKPATSPNALVEILALTPDQAKHLAGAERLNFWRNGSLHVQVQHGNRGIKLPCPGAIVTDAQLNELFTTWGWTQVNNKPYYRCTPNSVVRL